MNTREVPMKQLAECVWLSNALAIKHELLMKKGVSMTNSQIVIN